MDDPSRLLEARRLLARPADDPPSRKSEAEGGCGVIGIASSVPIEGRYLLAPLCQMKNRGNAKGGGTAAVGLSAQQLGVSEEVLRTDTLLQVAYLDPSSRAEVEKRYVEARFEVDQVREFKPVGAAGAGLEVPPPEVCAYFVRPRPDALERFRASAPSLDGVDAGALREEFVYRNSFELNRHFYASLGIQRAFVLSHGRDMLVFKLVGYGDQVVRAYGLEDLTAHVWVGHHRYPTKGRVWHPGGAHPFVGLNEALVHNGDFANYHSITRYLKQHGIQPLFLTDTEVSVLLFDLLRRTYRYPLERVFESLAPTTERDFEMLPSERKDIYRRLQQAHIHGSPDGPWFFIVASHPPGDGTFELIGITDTSMLRPQVFALQEGVPEGAGPSAPPARFGVIASEKQAIDAALRALHQDGKAHAPYADLYWNARGGSCTDGGAFVFTVGDGGLKCTNKFGDEVRPPPGRQGPLAQALKERLDRVAERARRSEVDRAVGVVELTQVLDSRILSAGMRRSRVVSAAEGSLEQIFLGLPRLGSPSAEDQLVDFGGRRGLEDAEPRGRLFVDALEFPPEGDESLARFVVRACERGFRNIACFRLRGHRFLGSGLGGGSRGLNLEVFGSSGDYLASGLDGAQIIVHGSAQDQVGNILTSGKLVIHGDVGQCFMYGAKGGEVYVLGSAAGRPLINAVGSPRVVLNGTALDYLAESFMAGDPLDGGGFVVVNGVEFDAEGSLRELPTPYPGGNLFSLATGGAVYIRDPGRKVTEDQLNGGAFQPLTDRDWELLKPCLEENERLFGIRVETLLTVKGEVLPPPQVYRKIAPPTLGGA